MPKKWTSWAPAVIVPVVVVAAAVLVPVAADASPRLPAKTAAELIQFISSSDATAYAGTVEQSSDVGLPQLPSMGGSDSADSGGASVLELASGTHEARVFAGGPQMLRVQVMDTLAERDVIRNGNDVWTWDSKSHEATHVTATGFERDPATVMTKTPAEIAAGFLDSVDSSTAVSVTDTARVAGRSVYQLVLDPKAGTTLVDSVTLAIDSETGLPLGVTVAADGQSAPAFSAKFTAIDFSTPDASLFTFTPPPGATVTEKTLDAAGLSTGDGDHAVPSAVDGATVSGSGWASIVQIPAGRDALAAVSTDPTLSQLVTKVDGGSALQTSLLSILITDDGRVLAGAVPVSQLEAAAGR